MLGGFKLLSPHCKLINLKQRGGRVEDTLNIALRAVYIISHPYQYVGAKCKMVADRDLVAATAYSRLPPIVYPGRKKHDLTLLTLTSSRLC